MKTQYKSEDDKYGFKSEMTSTILSIYHTGIEGEVQALHLTLEEARQLYYNLGEILC